MLFGEERLFSTHAEQESYIRSFLPSGRCESLKFEFYAAFYKELVGSIFPEVRLPNILSVSDWLILEEPEHLNWLQPFNDYHSTTKRITGICVTHYLFYMNYYSFGCAITSKILNTYNRWLVNRHCNEVIRVSEVLPVLPKSHCLYVNGVHPDFLEVEQPSSYKKTIYFMGKLIWPKGFREMVDLLSQERVAGDVEVDVFGKGFDREAIAKYAQKKEVRLNFKGLSFSPTEDLKDYKIFLNTSRSEIICTTTVEAIAMGKFVLLPEDPTNQYFYRFRNCLAYSSPTDFIEKLEFALVSNPEKDPLIEEFSWESAIDRLLDVIDQNPLDQKSAPPPVFTHISGEGQKSFRSDLRTHENGRPCETP